MRDEIRNPYTGYMGLDPAPWRNRGGRSPKSRPEPPRDWGADPRLTDAGFTALMATLMDRTEEPR